MEYRFYGDVLQLIHYKCTVGEEFVIEAVTDSEKEAILKQYPEAIVTEIDNTGYEWLDGMVFTQEQLRAGELEQAIEMGHDAYMAIKNAPTQEKINAMLMLEIAKLKAGVNNG